MKIGVSSFSYERLTRAGAMSMRDTISKAKEQGFEVIAFEGMEGALEGTALGLANLQRLIDMA